jgi:ABC-type sugar transport system substrate-binding protein
MSRKLVVSLITEDQEFQRMQGADASRTAGKLGLDVEVLFAENNAVLQIQQLFRFVHAPEAERPLAIVTETVAGGGLERVARNAVKAGIAWVLVNRRVPYLDELRKERPDLATFMVSTDQEEIGRIQARQFRSLLPNGGSLLYVQGPPDTSVAQDRLRGAEEGLGGANIQMKVVNGDWTEQSGEKAVSSWLRLQSTESFHVEVIGSQNDSMAVGARRALHAVRVQASGVRFTGCDGLAEGGCRLVDDGALAATIVTPSNTGPAIEHLASWIRAGKVPPREVLLTPRSYPDESMIR